jgi:hypothetical protein
MALLAAITQSPPAEDVVAVVSSAPITLEQRALIGMVDEEKRASLASKLKGKVVVVKRGFIAIEFGDPMDIELRSAKLDLARQLLTLDFSKDIRLGDLKEPGRSLLIREVRERADGTDWLSKIDPIDRVPFTAWASLNLTFKHNDTRVQIPPPRWTPRRPLPDIQTIPAATETKISNSTPSADRSPGVMFHFGSRYSIRRRAEFMEAYSSARANEAASALVEHQSILRTLMDRAQVQRPELGASVGGLDPRIRSAAEMWFRTALPAADVDRFIAGAKISYISPTIRVNISARMKNGEVSGIGFGIDP